MTCLCGGAAARSLALAALLLAAGAPPAQGRRWADRRRREEWLGSLTVFRAASLIKLCVSLDPTTQSAPD